VQEVAVGFALLPVAADHAPWIAEWLLWAAVVLTVWSGIQYLADARRSAVARPAPPRERNEM
jgi:phosphatidylglycerophosphate synthase